MFFFSLTTYDIKLIKKYFTHSSNQRIEYHDHKFDEIYNNLKVYIQNLKSKIQENLEKYDFVFGSSLYLKSKCKRIGEIELIIKELYIPKFQKK